MNARQPALTSTIYLPAAQGELYSPFHLHIDPMERLLLVNFTGDPDEVYVGFEPQVFDDPVHGSGLIVIAWRVDGRVDVYRQPGVRLDAATYDIAGKGLADMLERPLEDAYFEVTPSGVDAYFAFDDALGRPVEVKIHERGAETRRPFGLLAPMGAAATAPSALPLVFVHDFYFVRRANTEVRIMVAGEPRRPDSLPLLIDGSRMYLLRYSARPLIATLNPAHGGPLLPLELVGEREARADGVVYDLVENRGQLEIQRLRRSFEGREVAIDFSPPWPNVVNLAEGAQVTGTFAVHGDPSAGTVSGEYHLERRGNELNVRATPSGGWRPAERKLSVRFLYAVQPLFRNWPKSYLWTARIDLGDGQPFMHSRWERTP